MKNENKIFLFKNWIYIKFYWHHILFFLLKVDQQFYFSQLVSKGDCVLFHDIPIRTYPLWPFLYALKVSYMSLLYQLDANFKEKKT
jgi:hypothetical protein